MTSKTDNVDHKVQEVAPPNAWRIAAPRSCKFELQDRDEAFAFGGIKAAMGTENAGKVLRGCEYLFGDNILPRGFKPDLILHNAIKYTAFRVSLSGTTRMCMLASVNEILGVENEDNSPDVKKIGNRDLMTIYTVLEDFAKENVDLG